MSEREYQECLDFMSQSLQKGQGMVGIFWYSPATNKLFGVHKEKPNEYNKQKFKNNGEGFFIGDYKDKPRGRIFYVPNEDRFVVCVGSWIRENTDAIDVIVDEFGLERENYDFEEAEHGEIGMGYGEE